MQNIKLSQLFQVINGKHIDESMLSDNKKNYLYIPYIRPSNSMNNIISGYIDEKTINKRQIFQANSLFVGISGQGSHTFSYVCPYKFTPNSNISVLIPKFDMTIIEKNIYAKFITANRYKFSYGRVPAGNKLKSIMLPCLSFVKSLASRIPDITPPSEKPYHYNQSSLNDREWTWFNVSELFDISSAKIVNKQDIEDFTGVYPYVSRTTKNNGVDEYISNIGLEDFINKGDVITIGTEGRHPFYQKNDFLAGDGINMLKVKSLSNIYIQIFLCTILGLNNYRYNYGRGRNSGRLRMEQLRLPIDHSSNPDWEFIEYYVKSLTYSSNL